MQNAHFGDAFWCYSFECKLEKSHGFSIFALTMIIPPAFPGSSIPLLTFRSIFSFNSE